VVRFLFELGRVVATPSALATLEEARIAPRDLLARHQSGDWGDLEAFDRRENARALLIGARILSAYRTPAGKIWVITEADRSSTCVLRPEDY
jgi:hypothetical protein